LCFGFFLLCLVEGVSRFFYRQDRLDEILYILEEDPYLFWRQKTNLDVQFQGVRLNTDGLGLRNKIKDYHKTPGSFRIVCLGASPTFGWGVKYENTYPRQLGERLKKGGYEKIEVINAGNIGYTSYQGLIFLKKAIEDLDPDLITVSFVLNELDKYRFYRSNGKADKELEPENTVVVGFRNILSNSRFYRLLMRMLGKKGGLAGNDINLHYPGQLRVSPDDYRKNLQAIVDFARERAIEVVLIKMPVNLPIPGEVTKLSYNRANDLLARGIEYIEYQEYEKAAEVLHNAIKHNPYLSTAFYYIGLCSDKLGRISEAKEYFRHAKKAEAYRCGKDGLVYNAVLEEVAVNNGLCLVDVVSAFQKINDKYLFIHPRQDPIHPNADGHKIIGIEIYNVLTKNKLLPKVN